MSRLTNLAFALTAGSIAAIGLAVGPAHAGASAGEQSALVGELGYEGGVAPGGFHPTAGTVEVTFASVPLTLLAHVGKSGHFDIKLSPGSYTVTGCGPAATGASAPCGRSQKVHLTRGEVDHIQLVWAYVP